MSIPILDTGYGPFDTYDCGEAEGGHGTDVTDLIAAVAPNAALTSQATCAANGSCDTYSIVRRLLEIESTLLVTGRRTIANLSFSGGYDPKASIDLVLYRTLAALEHSYQDNFLVVAAAGNNGLDEDPEHARTPLFPAAFSPASMQTNTPPLENILSVAASGWLGAATMPTAAAFNPQGVGTDLLAPGVGLCPRAAASCAVPLNGTSYATALTTGVAALLWEQCPELQAAEVRDLLRRKATPGTTGDERLLAADPLVTCDGGRATPLGWYLFGSAALDEHRVALTQGQVGNLGGAFNRNAIDLHEDISLRFNLYLGADERATDGLLFSLLPELPLNLPPTADGGFLGFSGLCSTCLGIEIDTYRNWWDPSASHLALVLNGSVTHDTTLPLVDTPVFDDDREHSLQIDWDADTTQLRVSVDGHALIEHTIDLVEDVFNGHSRIVYGFLGASGTPGATQYFYPVGGPLSGLLYQSNPDGGPDYDIYLIDPDGGAPTILLDSLGSVNWARWDAAGERLYLAELGSEGEVEHRIVRPDFIQGGLFPDPLLREPLFQGGSPSVWHPGGKAIIWKRTDDNYTGEGPYVLHDLASGSDTVFIDPTIVGDYVPGAIAIDFAPDGRSVVWQSSVRSNAVDNDIWWAQLGDDGMPDPERTNVNLTPNSVLDASPRFSPVGEQVAIIRSFNPQGHGHPSNIILIDFEGNEAQLTHFTSEYPQLVERLVWSPDGEYLAIALMADEGASFDLWTVRVSDGELQQVTNTEGVHELPMDWR